MIKGAVVAALRNRLENRNFSDADIDEICSSLELLGTTGAHKVTSRRLDLVTSPVVASAIQGAVEEVQASEIHLT